MRLSKLVLISLILSSCTGVQAIDETWACASGNIPKGKACKPIPTAEIMPTYSRPSYNTNSPTHNAATIEKKSDKNEKKEYPDKMKTPPKTW